MNGITLRAAGTILLITLLTTSGGVLWWQQSRHTVLQGQLMAVTRERDGAQQTARSQSEQMDALLVLQQQQAVDLTAQQHRLDTLVRAAAEQTTQLETLFHDNPDAQRWGDTRLPAAVARLLDTTDASPVANRAALPAGDGLLATEPPAADQP